MVYNLISGCWASDAARRPTMAELSVTLRAMSQGRVDGNNGSLGSSVRPRSQNHEYAERAPSGSCDTNDASWAVVQSAAGSTYEYDGTRPIAAAPAYQYDDRRGRPMAPFYQYDAAVAATATPLAPVYQYLTAADKATPMAPFFQDRKSVV